jgi:hypothetical protein
MIYLFDNCYLSLPNTLVETCKHVWIGAHEKLDDPYLSKTYDIYKTYKTINTNQLTTLLTNIHSSLSNEKIVIYCDVKYFQVVYSSFFGSLLSEEGVKQLYKYDRLKENYGIGSKLYGMAVSGFKPTNTIELPEQITISSPCSFIPTDYRVELAFANYVSGKEKFKEYCVDRISKMYDGSPGFWLKYAEQNLPAILDDSEYTIQNLLDDKFIKNKLEKFNVNEVIPNKTLELVKEEFNVDYLNHFFNVINENGMTKEQCASYWSPVCSMTKEEFIESKLLNTSIPIKFQLLFPNLSNFDSINPILWNKIFENCNNLEWLSNFDIINGTDNQTDGTV